MFSRYLTALALASSVFAQDSNTPSLTEALSANNDTLGSLAALIETLPSGVVEALNNATNVTILAPSNDAITSFLNSSIAADIATDPGLLTAVLQYHILNGTYYASNLTGEDPPRFIPTMLNNETYANVTGGQRVEYVPPTEEGGNVTFYSALKELSTVTQADVNFTGGVIHVIDSVLSVPQGLVETLRGARLTAALGAIVAADSDNITEAATSQNVTYFIPDNEAFARIASLAPTLNATVLSSILSYHIVEGQVLYSDMIANTTIAALDGTDLNVTVIEGRVFVNNAEVVLQDLLVSNGVAHVINNVLNPANTTQTPDAAESTPPPAFDGASTASGGSNPLTSGVTEATSTAPAATGANPGAGVGAGGNSGGEQTTDSDDAAMPMRTGAIGVAALFGAGAVVLNM